MNLKAAIEEVRDQLIARAKQEARARAAVGPPDQARLLREVEREIDNIRAAVRIGKAPETLPAMLEDAEGRRKALQAGHGGPKGPRRAGKGRANSRGAA